MTDKLLGCPFCGRKAVKVGFHNGVQCPTAYCAGNAMVVEPSQWNRRAQPDTRDVCVVCGKGGYEGSLHSIEDGPWHHEHCRAALRAQQEEGE